MATLAADAKDPQSASFPEALPLVLQSAALLFANGETTERTIAAGNRVAEALGYRATVIPRWDQLTVRLDGSAGPQHDVATVAPATIDMNKVLAAEQTIDALGEGRLAPQQARSAFGRIAGFSPVPLGRFTLAAAVGAGALSVVFGVAHLRSIVLIAISAGAGALIRRGLSRFSPNLLLQPFAAAVLAGLIGGLAERYQLSSPLALIALCPCMVLVPGPHFLNGLLDLARARVELGCSRIVFASMVIVAISAGLLLGLWLVGGTLPLAPPSRSVSLPLDVVAAGLAVAAYGSFYTMPWRYLPIPMAMGMVAHAIHWLALSMGASVYASAFLSCLLGALVMTRASKLLRLPFAALAFAAVVSLIPGVFLFRMAAGLLQMAQLGERAPSGLVAVVLAEGSTAVLILLAMGLGLIAPKLLQERSRSVYRGVSAPGAEHVLKT